MAGENLHAHVQGSLITNPITVVKQEIAARPSSLRQITLFDSIQHFPFRELKFL